MGLLDGFTSGPVENPELDKTKLALDKLKPQIEGRQIDQLYPVLDEGLVTDLVELGVTDPAEQEGFKNQLHQAVGVEMARETPDFQALDNLVNNPKSWSALDQVIEGKKPAYEITKKLETFSKLNPKLGFLAKLAPVFVMLTAMQKITNRIKETTGKEASTLDKIMAFFAMGDSAESGGEKKETSELSEPLLGAIKKAFNEKGVKLYEDTGDKLLKGDFKWLVETAKMKIDETNIQELVDKTFVQNEKIKKLFKLADTKMALGTPFKARLEYLRLNDMQPTAGFDPLDALYAMLEPKDGPYELNPIDEKNINQLFHDVVGAKDAKSILDSKYKKKQTAVASATNP